jgi:cytochrome bd-type quinol oxidase subunit 2
MKIFKISKIIFIIVFCLILTNPVLAGSTLLEQFTTGQEETGKATGHLNEEGHEVGLFADRTLFEAIGQVVSVLLSILGVFFLLLMIYSGYTWMTARGNEQQAEKARNTMINAIIGLVIVLGAYSITAFISLIFENNV